MANGLSLDGNEFIFYIFSIIIILIIIIMQFIQLCSMVKAEETCAVQVVLFTTVSVIQWAI